MPEIRYLETQLFENMRLRYIEEKDLELLRTWKNANKKRFFYQNEILPKQQKAWFSGYTKRPDDFIFIVESNSNGLYDPMGCMGFRVVDDVVDIYNIIRGKKMDCGFSMSNAFHLMLNFIDVAFGEKEIYCKVLVDNPAVVWYEKNSFVIIEKKQGYFVMRINKKKLRPMKIKVG